MKKGSKMTWEQRKRISLAVKGRIPWNKNKKSTQKAWNKGLTKKNDSRVNKISKALKGRSLTKEHKKNISKNHPHLEGKKNPFYGKKHTKKTKKQIGIKTKKNMKSWWGNKNNENSAIFSIIKKRNKKISKKAKGCGNPFYGKKHSDEAKSIKSLKSKTWWDGQENLKKIKSKNMQGALNRLWSGGKRPNNYGKNWKTQKKKMMEKSEGICSRCKIKPKRTLEIHHKKPFRLFVIEEDIKENKKEKDYSEIVEIASKKANKLNNLVGLCKSCHMTIETKIKKKYGPIMSLVEYKKIINRKGNK
jgi:5-methylcytosine-specific restriction endonuclease McrA